MSHKRSTFICWGSVLQNFGFPVDVLCLLPLIFLKGSVQHFPKDFFGDGGPQTKSKPLLLLGSQVPFIKLLPPQSVTLSAVLRLRKNNNNASYVFKIILPHKNTTAYMVVYIRHF